MAVHPLLESLENPQDVSRGKGGWDLHLSARRNRKLTPEASHTGTNSLSVSHRGCFGLPGSQASRSHLILTVQWKIRGLLEFFV